MVDAGLIVLTTFISPYRADREMARRLFNDGEFFEIFVNTPIEICEKRDPKGLYKKARKGEIKNFTGIDSAYEAPEKPYLTINTHSHGWWGARFITQHIAMINLASLLGRLLQNG